MANHGTHTTLKDELKRAGGPYTKFGAGLLADAINAYWAARGARNVQAERYSMPTLGLWGVRSNLVAGLPPRATHIGIDYGSKPSRTVRHLVRA